MECVDERIDRIAKTAADIGYSTFTKFQHLGANKSKLTKILRDNIKWALEQMKGGGQYD